MSRLCRVTVSGALTALSACADSTTPHIQRAEFVLRSVGGEQVPAFLTLGTAHVAIVAETLFVPLPDTEGSGVLWRANVSGVERTVVTHRSTAHDFVRRGATFLAFLDCEHAAFCIAILTYREGTLSDRELRFPGLNEFVPERVYERVR